MFKHILPALLFCATPALQAQVFLNEGSNRNASTIADEDGDYPDWIELYNGGSGSASLAGWYLSDDAANPMQWQIQGLSLPAGAHQVIFCSGKDRNENVHHWETALDDNSTYRYLVPTAATSTNWKNFGFNDAAWAQGTPGFGYGDGDDATLLPNPTTAVYARSVFTISDTSRLAAAILHVDYDDGFIAYLNGVEIARSNMSVAGWNTFADGQHEAAMYNGANPEGFALDMATLRSAWRLGTNVLAIEAHNVDAVSSDLSLIPFLTFGIADASVFYALPPLWFGAASARLHTNFKISGSGETVYLTDNTGTLRDSLVVNNLQIDYSLGCATDGSTLRGIFTTPTPNATNNTQPANVNGYEPAPTFSLVPGFYGSTQTVALAVASTTAQIRYTLDGQEPTAASPLYSAPLSLDTTTVVKARAFSTAGRLPSVPATASYFVNNAYQHGVPVISMTIENDDFYGAEGIYDNWWTDWKKPCHIEYFDADGKQLQFAQRAGVKIEGGAGGSRSQPMRSMRIELDHSVLGEEAVQYPLMSARPDRQEWAAFYLRNGSNQYLNLPYKDAILVEGAGKGTNNNYSAHNCVAVYLNGDFWGIYELREKQDVNYFEQNYGIDPDSLSLLGLSYWYNGVLRAVEGGQTALDDFWNDYNSFLALNPNSPNYLQDVDTRFDLDFYTDYVIAETWVPNYDWPQNNIKIYKGNATDDKWRFGIIDLELSFNPNGWSDRFSNTIDYIANYDPNNPYIHIWQNLMQNAEYHDYFINRYADVMNTAYQCEEWVETASRIQAEALPEMGYQHQRWGDPWISQVDYLINLQNNYLTLLSEVCNRNQSVRDFIQNQYGLNKQVDVVLDVQPAGAGTIRISTISPEEYPWTGVYFDGVPVRIEAVANFGYTFSHWDANGLIADVNDPIFWNNINIDSIPFTAHFQTAFTVSTDVTISEINYNSEPSRSAGDWIEFWNTSDAGIATLDGWYVTDNNPANRYDFPTGTTLAPDARLVIVANEVNFQTQFPAVAYNGVFAFGLSSAGDAVRLYNPQNQLVAEVVYADTLPWPPGANGQGYTLELLDPLAANLDDAGNWFAGCLGGSPRQPFTPCEQAVIFSEVNYKGDAGIVCGDWVELRNVTNAAIDVSGWTFRDEIDSTTHIFTIPNGTVLDPNENLVLAQDGALFTAAHPNETNFVGSFGFGLSGGGEWIRLYDATGLLRQSLRYDNNAPWVAIADGYTLELVNVSAPMNNGANWFQGCYGGSPTRVYDPGCGVGVVEIADELGNWRVFPNPTQGELWLDYLGENAASDWNYRLLDAQGRLIATQTISNLPAAISLRDLPSGLYLLQWSDGATMQTVRVVKE